MIAAPKYQDGRDFVESAYQRKVGAEGQLRWRIYYDRYRFVGRYDFQIDNAVQSGLNVAKGDWMGTQLTYRFRVPRIGFLTVGGEAELGHTFANGGLLCVARSQGLLARVNRPDRSLAVFFQDERQLSRRWTLYLGGRLDDSRNHQLLLTPRVALIYQPSPASAVKLLYGRSFRNPSPFEQFYEDGVSQVANPDFNPSGCRPSRWPSREQLGQKLELQANVYQYRLVAMIAAVLTSDLLQQYQNVEASHSTGFELEATGKLGSRFKIDASLAVQRSTDSSSAYVKVNSPARRRETSVGDACAQGASGVERRTSVSQRAQDLRGRPCAGRVPLQFHRGQPPRGRWNWNSSLAFAIFSTTDIGIQQARCKS